MRPHFLERNEDRVSDNRYTFLKMNHRSAVLGLWLFLLGAASCGYILPAEGGPEEVHPGGGQALAWLR
jgi:hypothetical protein